MIKCSLCGQQFFSHYDATTKVQNQVNSFKRHLRVCHNLPADTVKNALKNVTLMPATGEKTNSEDRWLKARLMWSQGKKIKEIATEYNLSPKAMRTRIYRWRRDKSWFPVR